MKQNSRGMIKKRLGTAVTVWLLLAGIPAGLFAGAIREERRTLSLEGIDTLAISYSSARISLRDTEEPELILIERLRNARDAEVVTEGGTLRVTGDKRPWVPFAMRRIEAEIGIPRSFQGNLQVQSRSGPVHTGAAIAVSGLIEIQVSSGTMNLSRLSAREIVLRSSSGSIHAGDLIGSTDIHASSGSLELGRLEGMTHRIRSSSGSIHAERIAGSADVDLSSGTLRIGSLDGAEHRIRSVSGAVYVDSLTGGADISASSGNVEVKAARLTGNLSFNLKSGGLDLGIPRTEAFNLDAETSSGRLTINSPEGEYAVRDRGSVYRPVGENPQYTVLVRVNSGRIIISRY